MTNDGAGAAAEKARELLVHFRKNGMPVFHVWHECTGANATFFIKDTDGIDIHRSVEPLPEEETIHKFFPNSFRETDLGSRLERKGIESLVIAGMMSHMCITSTTRAAADFGYACTVAHDACATKALSFGGVDVPASMVHAASMAALQRAFADVKPAADILESLRNNLTAR